MTDFSVEQAARTCAETIEKRNLATAFSGSAKETWVESAVPEIAAALYEALEAAEEIAYPSCNLTAEVEAGAPPRSCQTWCHITVAAALAALRSGNP